jgi:Transcriptional regulator, AbiEi antitoxin
MNPKLIARARVSGGVFSRRDALDCGYTAEQVRSRLADGRWRRIRRGYYAEAGEVYDALPAWERELFDHRLAVHAVARSVRPGGAAISHWSALVMHGIPVWAVDLGTVHVTRIAGRSSRTVDGLCQHVGRIHPDDLIEMSGLLMTSPTRALVETACVADFESIVVSADAALRDGLVSRDAAGRLLRETLFWPGGPRARTALAFADGRAASVGESRLRLLFDRHALPRPTLQAQFRDSDGEFVGRVDFYFPAEGVVIEFDGRTKYGSNTRQAILAEKEREDRLRGLGLIVVRVTWHELDQPSLVVARIRRAFARAAA